MGNPKEDSSDAVKAFLAKGGKIKKLPPAKAQGYHGKDDPGKDVHGVMDKPDTKRMGTRKKVKSMEAAQVDEISKDTKKSYIKKAVNDVDNRSFAQGLRDKNPTYTSADSKNNRKIANRRAGINRALEAKETDPPFDDAKKISTTPAKDQFGNIIKNRAKHLARQAAKKAGGDMGDKQKKIRKESQELAELSPELLTRYAKKAIPQQFKKNDAANMPSKRGTEKGAKLQKTADKRKKGIDSVRKRSSPNDMGQDKTGRASRPHGGMRPGKGTSYKQKPAGGFNSKYLDQ
jgi:hypothetical protein